MTPSPADDHVIVLDSEARPVGIEEKQAAHSGRGVPHLAFSVVLFDSDGRVLLQRRSWSKHHFAGYWSNSCCSHPRADETVSQAATRRLQEELGVHVEDLWVQGAFWYEARDDVSGLVEREYDVVLTALSTSPLRPASDEVVAVQWVPRGELMNHGEASVEPLSPWTRPVLELAFADRPFPVSRHIAL